MDNPQIMNFEHILPISSEHFELEKIPSKLVTAEQASRIRTQYDVASVTLEFC